MVIKKLKVEITGGIWLIKELEVESIDVKSKWKDGTGSTAGSVTVENLPLSNDSILDVYVHVLAPNTTVVKVNVSGSLVGVTGKIEYEEEGVVRHGKLRITISKSIQDLLDQLV